MRVPINFVTSPAVSLRAACFPHDHYEDDNSGDCLSNLLASGYRKFVLDLYWDQGRSVWSFCPVAIPPSSSGAAPQSIAPVSSGARASLVSGVLSNTSRKLVSAPTAQAAVSDAELRPRQETATTAPSFTSSSIDSASTSGSSLGETLPSASTIPDTPNGPLVAAGPYICTPSVNLSTFTSQLLDYIQKTHNTLGARLLYVIINLHAAASATNPAGPAPSPTNLPTEPNFIGNQFSSNLSGFIYSEQSLKQERGNLNSSWYTVTERYRPLEGYYTTETIGEGVLTTRDGWPSEAYIEFEKSRRLLLGWGTVDPQMSNYNFSGDLGTIFPRGYLTDVQTDLNATESGNLTSGCFSHDEIETVSETNSSWAVATNVSGFDYPVTPSAGMIYPPPLAPLKRNLSRPILVRQFRTPVFCVQLPDRYFRHIIVLHWTWNLIIYTLCAITLSSLQLIVPQISLPSPTSHET